MLRQRRPAALILAAMAALVGCSALSDGDSGTEPPATIVSGGTVTSPFGAESAEPSSLFFEVPAGDSAALRVATDESVANCMAAQGFKYVPLDLATAQRAADAEIANRRAELPIDFRIESLGYLALAEVPARQFDNDAYANNLGDSERAAWSNAALGDFDDVTSVVLPGGITFDFPNSGCLTEARVEVFGSIEGAIGFEAGLSRIRIDAHLRTRAKSDVIEALASWSLCMKDQTGLDFIDFTRARQFAMEHPDQDSVVASADSRCTQETRLREIYVESFENAVAILVEEHTAILEEYNRAISEAVQRIDR